MAEETRRIPVALSGPTTPTAVLLPMRLFVGWYWLRLGFAHYGEGWLSMEPGPLQGALSGCRPWEWFGSAILPMVRGQPLLFQWLTAGSEILVGAMVLVGAATRLSGTAAALMGLVWVALAGEASGPGLPLALMAITLAIAAAGRYLGVDAILRARTVRIPLF